MHMIYYFKKRNLISVLLMLFMSLQAFGQKVTVNIQNAPISSVLTKIQKDYGYSFAVKSNDLDLTKTVSVSARNQNLVDLISKVFDSSGQAVDVTMSGKILSISMKKNLPSEAPSSKVDKDGIHVKGIVTDADTGEPVIGASIIRKGTSNGVITGLDGSFQISVPSGTILSISSLGYQTTEVAAQAILNVALFEDISRLDEVLVVGYGTATRRSLISSVSTVDAKSVSKVASPNITQSLAGRTPGIIAKSYGGSVNNLATISIRGGGTPLIVIDGVIRAYEDFAYINPEDIESINILKDASATAVYGSRATSGIIQITTKKAAQNERFKIDYSFQERLAEFANYPDFMDSWDRAEYANIARVNDGMPEMFSETAIQAMKDGSDPQNYNNTNWKELCLRRFAPMQKHNLTMQGGTNTAGYYMSLGYIDEGSMYINNTLNMQRANFNFSVTNYVEKIGLRTTVSIDGYRQFTRNNYWGFEDTDVDYFAQLYQTSPLVPAYNKHGYIFAGATALREVQEDNGYKKHVDNTVNGKISIDWSLPWVKGLSFWATGNYHYHMNTAKKWSKFSPVYQWDAVVPDTLPNMFLHHSSSTGYQYTLQAFGEYKNTFGKHTVDFLGGYEASYGFGDSYWANRQNYDFPIDQLNVGPAKDQTNDGSETEFGRAAWVFQAKYSYDNRYYVEGSMRIDGSDLFPEDHRWGTFYSGSVGWHLANERFMKGLKDKHVFDVLKLRASYGEIGLDSWGAPYGIGRFEYLSTYYLDTKARVVNGEFVPGFAEGALPSPDITWFTTYQSDAGIDFESLNHRLYGSFDWFYYRTTGFLYSPDPLEVGYTAPLGQSLPKVVTDGEHRREGFDFNIGWRDHISDFTYDISFNFTKYDELWNVLPSESVSSLMNPYLRSTQVTGYYGNMLHNLGFFNSSEEVYNAVLIPTAPYIQAGDIHYEDFNGDGKIDTADHHHLGKNFFPRGNYGILFNLGYKGFAVNGLLQGCTAFDMYLTPTNLITPNLPVAFEFETDYWTPENKDALLPRLSVNPAVNGNNNHYASDFWLVNGAYLRMKSLDFSYDFKYKLLKKADWLSTCSLGISGTNLFTISEANKYFMDPEDSANRYAYPYTRTYAITLKVGF